MKGFIEVTVRHEGRKISINSNKVVSFGFFGGVTKLDVEGNVGFVSVEESYEEIKQLIVEATK